MATTIMFEDEDGVFRAVSADNPLPTTGSGGGGGAVESVNGQTGEVVLNSSNIDVVIGGVTIGQLNDSLQSLGDSVVELDNTKLNSPTGTANSTTYARGDGTWATPPNTTYSVVSQANIENPASTSSGLITGQRLAQGIAAQVADTAGEVGLLRAVFIENGETPPSGLDPYTLVIELEA